MNSAENLLKQKRLCQLAVLKRRQGDLEAEEKIELNEHHKKIIKSEKDTTLDSLISLNKDTLDISEDDPRLPLYHYGMEIRHLPLFRYLQASPKCVTTQDWQVARHELRFSKLFDRLAELKLSRAWGPQNVLLTALALEDGRRAGADLLKRQLDCKTSWDAVLGQVSQSQSSMLLERNWRMQVARQLAYEAVKKRQELRRPLFYEPSWLEARMALAVELGEALRLGGDADLPSYANMLKSASFEPKIPVTPPPEVTSKSSVMDDRLEKTEYLWILEHSPLSPDFAAFALNTLIHGARQVLHPLYHIPTGLQRRSVSELEWEEAKSQRLAVHRRQMSMMRGQKSKLVPPIRSSYPTSTIRRSTRPTKAATATITEPSRKEEGAGDKEEEKPKIYAITFNVHPSHESVLRKANLHQTKLAIPGEILQRKPVRAGEDNTAPGDALLLPGVKNVFRQPPPAIAKLTNTPGNTTTPNPKTNAIPTPVALKPGQHGPVTTTVVNPALKPK